MSEQNANQLKKTAKSYFELCLEEIHCELFKDESSPEQILAAFMEALSDQPYFELSLEDMDNCHYQCLKFAAKIGYDTFVQYKMFFNDIGDNLYLHGYVVQGFGDNQILGKPKSYNKRELFLDLTQFEADVVNDLDVLINVKPAI